MFDFLKKEEVEIVAPVDGTCMRLSEVKDTAFASGSMGVGFAIATEGDVVVAPVSGTIVVIPETRHAFGIQTKGGTEVLVHIGLNSVLMLGEGFTALANQGDEIQAGEPVIRLDRPTLEAKDCELTTIVTFTSGNVKSVELDRYGEKVKAGDLLAK